MLKTKEIRLRLTDEEFARVKTKAQLRGFNTMSAYARDRLLRINFLTKKRLMEIYETLVKRSY